MTIVLYNLKSTAVILLILCLSCQFGIAANVSGTVRLSLSAEPSAAPEKRRPARSPAVTLCSPERLYRVTGDQQGEFEFVNVQPGSYDLVAAISGLAPDTLPNLNVIGRESIGPIAALVHDGPRTSPCWVNSSGQSVPYDYDVNYEAPNPRQSAAVIRGEAGQWVKKNTTTPLRKARISLFRAGDSSPLTSTESDKGWPLSTASRARHL